MDMKKNKQTINYGQKLKLAIESLGLTQEKVAEYLDLGPRYISDIENNKGNISVDTLEIIANNLKIESYLLIKPQKHPTLPKRVNMK